MPANCTTGWRVQLAGMLNPGLTGVQAFLPGLVSDLAVLTLGSAMSQPQCRAQEYGSNGQADEHI